MKLDSMRQQLASQGVKVSENNHGLNISVMREREV
jgi:hypothetical protein